MAIERENPAVQDLLTKLKARVDALLLDYHFPVLAILRLGEDPAAVREEQTLLSCAEAVGVFVRRYIMPADLTREDLELLIGQINADPLLTCLLLWQPLPAHLEEASAFSLIAPEKRVLQGDACEILQQVVSAAERRAQ